MRTSARSFHALAALVTVVGITALPAAAASPSVPSASSGKDQCGPGEMCVWEHDNWKGCFSRLPAKHKDWSKLFWETCPDVDMEDMVSSYVNNTPDWVGFWKDRNYRDVYGLCLSPGGSSNSLNNLRKFEFLSFEDRVSAHVTLGPDRPAFMYPDGDGYCETYDEN